MCVSHHHIIISGAHIMWCVLRNVLFHQKKEREKYVAHTLNKLEVGIFLFTESRLRLSLYRNIYIYICRARSMGAKYGLRVAFHPFYRVLSSGTGCCYLHTYTHITIKVLFYVGFFSLYPPSLSLLLSFLLSLYISSHLHSTTYTISIELRVNLTLSPSLSKHNPPRKM